MIIDIIAPSGAFPTQDLPILKKYIEAKGYTARIPTDILGPDLLSANSEVARFKQLEAALYAEDSEIIWCVRGGYGATRLLPELSSLRPPQHKKTLIGFSDITALHLLLSQKWGWHTLHGPSLRQMAKADLDLESIQLTEDIVFGKQTILDYALTPFNAAAEQASHIKAHLSGGNLKLIEASLATCWQIDNRPKILVLEEVNEYDYRVDRSLVHLIQSQVLQSVQAIILGDFTHDTQAHEAKIELVLQRFAASTRIPVFRLPGVGHGQTNFPWFYQEAQITDGHLRQQH
jgi:muramoyltetrapeptide carboxypeptidase